MKNAQRRIYSVSEITQRVKFLLEDSFDRVWVEGEISNFKRHYSGHLYFSIKDAGSQLSVVMFRSSAQRLKFEPENGRKVIVKGNLTVYERSGNYQINATGMEVCGLGELQLAFEQLKAKLEEEGLFSPDYKKELPTFPKTIGLVTSPTGAAVRDMLNVLERRFEGLNIIITPVRVQGKLAAGEIAAAIRQLNDRKCPVNCDLIITGRGGGSMEDLWAFNEEVVARAIFESQIPVISAVGHETDWSMSDFVADLRAPTPSAAAELAVTDKDQIVDHIEGLTESIHLAMQGIFTDRKSRLQACTSHYVMKEPINLLRQFQQRVDELSDKLVYNMKDAVQNRRSEFNTLAQRMTALNPLAVLGRGYSVTKDEKSGKIIKQIKDAPKGTIIQTLLSDGKVISRVETTSSK